MNEWIKFLKKTIRAIRIRIFHAIGRLSYRHRMIPQFLIIGTQKGGTSSLFYYLKYHPQIKRPIKKEIHYYNIYFEKGIKWYIAHFPLKSDQYITGEASPDYMFHPLSAKRIQQLNPDIKLIVLLRNPIERAYSAYQMNKRMGIDQRETFEDAVHYELQRSKEIADDYNYDKHNFFYLERGKYDAQLSILKDYFSIEQLLLIDSQQFFKNTETQLLRVYNFLGIKPILPRSNKAMNVGHYPPLSHNMYETLKDYFLNDMERLKENWNIEVI